MRIGAGRDGNLREDILGAGANQAHTFGAAKFYTAQQWSHAVHRGAGAGCMRLNSLATPPKTHAKEHSACRVVLQCGLRRHARQQPRARRSEYVMSETVFAALLFAALLSAP